MDFQNLLTAEDALAAPAQPLFGATLLLKSVEGEGDDAPWRFSGIASDEETDVDGDVILKKSIDLTYAKQRGYVNWDHSRQPEDQLGYLTKAEVIGASHIKELKKSFPHLSETASVYVEGELYKELPKAKHVYSIMKSTPGGAVGLGLSLDGAVARDVKNHGVIKAFVRGVAITSQPAQPKTLVRLKKSIQAYAELQEVGLPADLPAAIAGQVVELLQKGTAVPAGMEHDQAVLYVLKQRPRWTYELASKVVNYTMTKSKRS